MKDVLAVRSLSFVYPSLPMGLGWLAGMQRRSVPVLEGVSFKLGEGERACVMGSNGAGKSTLLKIILGFLDPSRGSVEVFGENLSRREIARRTGFVHPDERSFYWRLTVRQNLAFFGGLWGMAPGEARDRVVEISKILNMEEWMDRLFSDLSTGMRQKVAIARALIHDPPILVMDEPTRSLDPPSAARFRSWLKSPVFAGRTMLIATHNPYESRELAGHCLVLRGRKLVWDGAPLGEKALFAAMEGGN